MSLDKKNDYGIGVISSTTTTTTTKIGYIQIQPIYNEHHHYKDYATTTVVGDNDDWTTKTTLLPPQPPPTSSTTTYVEPIGRKELAISWWKHCPNQCMAYIPSSSSSSSNKQRPCQQYCRPLRKYVSILSKKMITTKWDSINDDNDDDHESYTTISSNNSVKSNNYHPKRILIKHPNAVLQKQQNDLIHITSIIHHNSSSSNATSHLSSSSSLLLLLFTKPKTTILQYHLRIGNDWKQPWMQFHVYIDQPLPLSRFMTSTTKFNPATYTTLLRSSNNSNNTTTTTTTTKRKLDFQGIDNNKLTYSEQLKRKRSNDRNNASFTDDVKCTSQHDNRNRIASTSTMCDKPRTSSRRQRMTLKGDDHYWITEYSDDNIPISYQSDESEIVDKSSTTTTNHVVISTQQQFKRRIRNATTITDPYYGNEYYLRNEDYFQRIRLY